MSIGIRDYLACLMPKDYTPLSPGEVEHEIYCGLTEGGVGLTLVNEPKGKTLRVEFLRPDLPAGDFPKQFPNPSAPSCEHQRI